MNYRVEWMPVAAILGVVTLFFVPILGLLAGLAILVTAAVASVVVIGSVLAAPYLIIRSVRDRWQGRVARKDSATRGLDVELGESTVEPFEGSPHA